VKVLLAFLLNSITNFVIGLMVAKYLGPEEYGRFAIAFAVTAVVQTALFDWLRLSACATVSPWCARASTCPSSG
jgi:membrane associated rhomboid family serine protease